LILFQERPKPAQARHSRSGQSEAIAQTRMQVEFFVPGRDETDRAAVCVEDRRARHAAFDLQPLRAEIEMCEAAGPRRSGRAVLTSRPDQIAILERVHGAQLIQLVAPTLHRSSSVTSSSAAALWWPNSSSSGLSLARACSQRSSWSVMAVPPKRRPRAGPAPTGPSGRLNSVAFETAAPSHKSFARCAGASHRRAGDDRIDRFRAELVLCISALISLSIEDVSNDLGHGDPSSRECAPKASSVATAVWPGRKDAPHR